MVSSMRDLRRGDHVRIRGQSTHGTGTVTRVGDKFAFVQADPGCFAATGWWSAETITLLEPSHPDPVLESGDGRHIFAIHSTFNIGDRVHRFGSAGDEWGTVRELLFKVLDGGLVVREVRALMPNGGTIADRVENLVLVPPPPPPEFRLGDRVTHACEKGGTAGKITGLHLNGAGGIEVVVLWDGLNEASMRPAESLRHAL